MYSGISQSLVKAARGSTKSCSLCLKPFDLFSHEHICKRCLRPICSKCSPEKLLIMNYDLRPDEKHRVCKVCESEYNFQKVLLIEHKLSYGKTSGVALRWLQCLGLIKNVDSEQELRDIEQSYTDAAHKELIQNIDVSKMKKFLSYSFRDYAFKVQAPTETDEDVSKRLVSLLNKLAAKLNWRTLPNKFHSISLFFLSLASEGVAYALLIEIYQNLLPSYVVEFMNDPPGTTEKQLSAAQKQKIQKIINYLLQHYSYTDSEQKKIQVFLQFIGIELLSSLFVDMLSVECFFTSIDSMIASKTFTEVERLFIMILRFHHGYIMESQPQVKDQYQIILLHLIRNTSLMEISQKCQGEQTFIGSANENTKPATPSNQAQTTSSSMGESQKMIGQQQQQQSNDQKSEGTVQNSQEQKLQIEERKNSLEFVAEQKSTMSMNTSGQQQDKQVEGVADKPLDVQTKDVDRKESSSFPENRNSLEDQSPTKSSKELQQPKVSLQPTPENSAISQQQQQAIQQLQGEVQQSKEDLKQKEKDLIAAKERARAAIAERDLEIAEREREKALYIEEMDKLKQAVKMAEARQKSGGHEHNNLALDQLWKELQSLQNEKAQQKEKISSTALQHNKEKEQLQETINSSQRDRVSQEEALKNQETELASKYLEQIAQKEKDIYEFKQNERNILNGLEKARTEVEQNKTRLQEQSQDLEKTQQRNGDTMSLIQQSSLKSLEEVQQLKDALEEQRKQKKVIEEEHKMLMEKQEEAWNLRIEEIKVLEVELQSQNKELVEQNKQLQGDIVEADQRENTLIEEGKELRVQLDSLRKQLQEISDKQEQSEESNEELKSQILEKNAQIAKLMQRVKDVEEEIERDRSEAMEKAALLLAEKEEFRELQIKLQKELSGFTGQQGSFEGRIQELSGDKQRLEAANNELKELLRASQLQLQSQESEINKVKQELLEQKINCIEHSKIIQELTGNLAIKTEKLNQTQEELNKYLLIFNSVKKSVSSVEQKG